MTSAPVAHSLWASSHTRNRPEEHGGRLYVSAAAAGEQEQKLCNWSLRASVTVLPSTGQTHAWTSFKFFSFLDPTPPVATRTFRLLALWSVQAALYSIVFAGRQGATTDQSAVRIPLQTKWTCKSPSAGYLPGTHP